MSDNNILVWNVHGLNGHARCSVVRSLVQQERTSMVCLQETNPSNVCDNFAAECFGGGFDYAFLLAANTAGDVLLGWRTDS